MDPLIFRAALRATARVAFTAAVAGCGGTAIGGGGGSSAHGGQVPTPADDAAARQDSALANDATPGTDAQVPSEATVPSDSGLACNAPPPSSLFHGSPPADAVSASTFDCCIAELRPLLATEAGAEPLDAALADPNAVACCGAVVFAVDHGGADASAEIAAFGGLGSNARVACCDLLKWPGGPTCTPWGPPAPPAMPEEQGLPSYGGDELSVAEMA